MASSALLATSDEVQTRTDRAGGFEPVGFLGLTQGQRDADSQHVPIPTVAWNGDVVLLSPELLGVRRVTYGDFIAGNVLNGDLSTMVGRFPSVEGDWLGVVDYEIGYADGRPAKLHVVDQLVPFHVLRRLWLTLATPIGAGARS